MVLHRVPELASATLRRCLVASAVGVTVLLAVSALRGRSTLLFLGWNLFLAWVPYGLSVLATCVPAPRGRVPVGLVAVFFAWLFFLPNAPYIVTDVIYVFRAPAGYAPLYALIVAGFATTGLVLGLASIRLMHEVLRERLGPRTTWAVLGSVFVLTGVGVYVGRVLRWNSWDVLMRPGELVGTTLSALANVERHLPALAFSLAVGACVFGAYLLYSAHTPRRVGARS
ncbi:MAG: DUF1361 domain-containing protein [Planctomycetota bacterium]|nr:DUF1361 domain-containing protein [Planctomycetota bacterium]